MNWDLATPDACPVPDAYEDIDKLEFPAGGGEEQFEQQIAAAKAAAKTLIDSGAVGPIVGDEPAHFATEIAGVATPGQVPVNGQLPSITIRVRQVEPAPVPEPEPEQPEEETIEPKGDQVPPKGSPPPVDLSEGAEKGE
jgi:hypothetical protein